MDQKIEPSKSQKNRQGAIILAVVGCLIVSSIVAGLVWKRVPIKRPQEPVEPYSYYSENVTFQNHGANITLAGTLTLPSREGAYPAVILISGSGAQNRNYEYAGHKPFLVLADYLTRNGIAVLRYDDRGFGESTGNFAEANSLDLSFDTESAVQYLKTRKDIQANKIGLVGHSDGAMIAPMVAARSADVNFIVLLAGPGVQGATLLLDRQEFVERKIGLSEADIAKSRAHAEKIIAIINASPDSETVRSALKAFSKQHYDEIPDYAIPPGFSKEKFIDMQIGLFSSRFFKYFLTYDPASYLQQVTCPVLALNGSLDVQVPATANLAGIKAALLAGGNSNVVIHEIPGLNHAFQEATTGMPDEYGSISQTFSPSVMVEIREWIAVHCR
jgi:uncharacterized protein